MMSYAANPALREAHGAAARRRVLERFSLPAMLAQYAAFYDEVLAGALSGGESLAPCAVLQASSICAADVNSTATWPGA